MEFIQVIIFILVIIAVLYRNIQKENEKARKRNIAKPAPVETFSPDEETNSEDTEIPTAYPEYENKQITPDYLPQTTNYSSIQTQYYPQKKYKTEKAQNKEKEKYRNKKDTTSTNIKLNTAEEARRAFIYSEIFNRKY